MHAVGLPRDPHYFVEHLFHLQTAIRSRVTTSMTSSSVEALSAAAPVREGDTIFEIDLHAEQVLDEYFTAWGEELPLLLIAEGIEGDGGRTYPRGTGRDQVAFTCIVDPIDGTRGLMYAKRSAWVLAGIGPPPQRGLPTLADIHVAVQTEIPTLRSHLSDTLWAVAGGGVHAQTHDAQAGTTRTFSPRPSQATTLRHGFATVVKFFPGGKVMAAHIEESLAEALFPDQSRSEALFFDDEYICTGGQLYELIIGHDRFIADLRPLIQEASGAGLMCAHPYDLCTELIAREAGVIVTDSFGNPLADPLDIRVSCHWAGYANPPLRDHIEPQLTRLLQELALRP